MRYSLLLSILGLLLALLGLQAGSPWGVLLGWLALNFVALGIAHSRDGHGIFGKRPDGTLPWWSWLCPRLRRAAQGARSPAMKQIGN